MTRILVVNDTQEILEMFRLLLEEEGYEAILSSMPILKAGEVEQIHPDLILLDVVFGDQKTGWQMLEVLKLQRSTANIPVIVCTAAAREVQEQEGHLVAQNVRVIYKPFDIDELLEMIKKLLSAQGKSARQAEDA